MCQILPALVLSVDERRVEVDMQGLRATVDAGLEPGVAVGQYVLVDRGLVLRVIEPAEAEAIMAMYAEMEALFDAAPEGGSA
ncbi:MAG TPA: HypC/HybG/HupF family hydrogenase formation chaperone [Candidatus Limnocylindria bacterium]|jgi:hydrogenase assembly chaperone HypC/HupF|nr:HypC/HybG/HupF family hydrogenase formation chaperone [Candidatus Limnocylindria bacterium]